MNIDAILGETDDRELVYKGESFALPSEIPGECLAPFLADDLGLTDLLIDVFKSDNDSKKWMDVVIDVLRNRPRLPLEFLAAVKESFRILLGDEYERLMGKRPGIGFYTAFARSLPDEYGLSFTDFFDSPESSDETGGDPSQPTSPTSTPASTPETSGDTPTPTVDEAAAVEPAQESAVASA